jgi:YegS/Rv2252/BmrU family lipid kinase
MRRVLLLHNPNAARHNSRTVKTVASVLRGEGCEVDVEATPASGDAIRLARQAVEQGVDVVAVYGGDGTMIQAVEGFVGSDVALGLVPGGTGNLLAGNLKLPRDPRQAALTIAHGVPRRIDIGRIQSGQTVRYFAVACGAGYDAQVMAGTTGVAKRRWGMAAYAAWVIRTVGRIRPARYRLHIDGQSMEVDAATVLVANCNEIIPPLLKLGKGVSFDDGALDIVVLNAVGIMQAASVVWQLLRRGPDTARVRRFRALQVRVESDHKIPVQLDGEAAGETPITVSVIPRGLSVIVPDGNGTARF